MLNCSILAYRTRLLPPIVLFIIYDLLLFYKFKSALISVKFALRSIYLHNLPFILQTHAAAPAAAASETAETAAVAAHQQAHVPPNHVPQTPAAGADVCCKII